MKSCPKCNRTYPDDNLAFCLEDGSILSAPFDPQLNQPYSNSSNAEYPTVKISNVSTDTIPSLSPQPIFTTEAKQNYSVEKRNKRRGLIIGILVILVLTSGLIIGLGWNKWFGNNNTQAKQSDAETINNNSESKTTPTAKPTTTQQSTPLPKSTPSVAKKLDITGTWTGEFADRDAILFLNSQSGDSFSGILKNSKKAIVAISGHINPDTGQISIQENRVVEEATEGPAWILGSESGSLSTDGKRMSGRGKDKAGHSYSWAFTK